MKNKLTLHLLIILVLLLTRPAFPVEAQQSQLISASPANGSIKLNDEKIVALDISSGSKISGFDLRFNSSEPLVITDFVDQLGMPTGFDPMNYKKVVENNNSVQTRVSFIFPTSAANLPSNIKLYLKVKGVKNGSGLINLDSRNSQILDASGKAVQINQLSINYEVSNLSSGGFVEENQIALPKYNNNTAVVNMKVRLFGAQTNTNKHVKAVAVVVGRIGEGKFETLPQEFDLTPDPSDQTFSGTVAFPNFKDGNKFSIMLRADNYLLKRICKVAPTESKAGQYQCQTPELTLKSGETANFDFSGITLIAGDLGISDGFINGYDLAIVRNNLGNNSEQSIKLADLNFDGKVDSEDLKIVKFALENKYRKADN